MSKDKKEKTGPDRSDKYRRILKIKSIEADGINRSIWEIGTGLNREELGALMNLKEGESIESRLKDLATDQEKKAIDPTLIIPGIKEKEKTGLFRISASMTNQLTKHGGKKENLVSNIFHDLEPMDQSKILDLGIEIIGVNLTVAEHKINRAFYRLLRDYSEEYGTYLGNYPTKTETGLISPGLRLSPSVIYKYYSGKKNPSGTDIARAREAIESYSSKMHFVRWKRKYIDEGEVKYTIVEGLEQLCKLRKRVDLTEDEENVIDGYSDMWDAKGEIILQFHPLFAYQIESKYSALPDDIDRRLAIAAGGPNRVTTALNNLLNVFAQHLSVPTNGTKLEINTSNLYHILGLEKEIKAKRKKRLNEIKEKTIQACKELGILDKYEVKKGSKGQEKYIFTLLRDWF